MDEELRRPFGMWMTGMSIPAAALALLTWSAVVHTQTEPIYRDDGLIVFWLEQAAAILLAAALTLAGPALLYFGMRTKWWRA